MSEYFDVKGVSSSGKELDEVKNDEGIEVIAIDMSRQITPIKDMKSLWSTYKLLKKEKPNIVHTHTPKAGIVGMLAAKLAGVPHRLHTVAGLPLMEATGTKRKVLDFVERLTYSSATMVYPNSKGLYEFILQNNYTDQDKLKVIGNGSSNGIDTTFFSPEQISDTQKELLKKELNIEDTDFVFVFVGRLVGDKGINELITAFSQISKEAEPPHRSKLLLVGPLEQELDPLHPDTLKEIENNQDIISVGFQKDVRPYFAIADVLTFPSYREGFPNVVMQAGAMELPSIVSNINGCNEIIIEDQNGVIVPVKNDGQLKEAMEKMISDKDYYQHLKKNARSMIQSRYEQSVVWNALLNEYKTLIEKK
ncbi:glycosyltransferase family 4 protein [Chryseobacterium rhizosphaerae]|uniref:Glycosyltransferase family 1 protein n=1 Tax=Chryseobacterium rhizosphaerae TaxID=395937 RepID=A0ABX9II62_9FLAO|nr:glycosyltransferase family 4 protein [Chryseobacterium rhizosphaerae]MDC8099707.1 glycosyltransferase family 4 protein [Chryseobacterium rhizosphaerae]REC72829.1 glycosyltransferase family 1 protein [Chryseobacterium rhizosphaerae]GEN67402.1 glycosyl transferase family 1 [Chryseobacterium rhizosphaerae]